MKASLAVFPSLLLLCTLAATTACTATDPVTSSASATDADAGGPDAAPTLETPLAVDSGVSSSSEDPMGTSPVDVSPGEGGTGVVGDETGNGDGASAASCSAFPASSYPETGVPVVELFFAGLEHWGEVVDGQLQDIDGDIAELASELGLAPGASALEIQTALRARVIVDTDADFALSIGRPDCGTETAPVALAAAACAESLEAAEVDLECEGHCSGLSGGVTCPAVASVQCEEDVAVCDGGCFRQCDVELETPAACGGLCLGTCDLDLDASGRCPGLCSGTCRFEGEDALSCPGACSGECHYTPPEGGCSGGATTTCRMPRDFSFECPGQCEGPLRLPNVSPACEAVALLMSAEQRACAEPAAAAYFSLTSGADSSFVDLADTIKTLYPRFIAYSGASGGIPSAPTILSAIDSTLPGLLDEADESRADAVGCAKRHLRAAEQWYAQKLDVLDQRVFAMQTIMEGI